jgi:hypothetical protein
LCTMQNCTVLYGLFFFGTQFRIAARFYASLSFCILCRIPHFCTMSLVYTILNRLTIIKPFGITKRH